MTASIALAGEVGTTIAPGVVLPATRRAALHALLGRTLTEDAWAENLTGHRVLVAPEPVAERTKGLLYKPRSAVEREQLEMGAGWIIAAGPLAGQAESQQHPVGLISQTADDLLGLHVIYRQYSGINLKTTEEDTEFGGQFALVLLTDRDILSWRPGI